MLIDTHVHVVAAATARYPLRPPGVGSDWFRVRPVDVDGFTATARAAGVDRAVLVQAYGAYGTDNGYVVDAADTDPSHLVSVAIVDSADDHLDDTIADLAAHVSFGGIRVFAIGDPAPNPLTAPGTRAIWRAAREHGFPLVVATLADGLPALVAIVREFPDVTVLLDHCGFAGVDALRPLADLAPLHLKVSSHVLETAVAAGDDPAALVLRLAELYGPARLLWGSDFPQTADHSYAELVDLATRSAELLPGPDRVAFTGANARRIWPQLGP